MTRKLEPEFAERLEQADQEEAVPVIVTVRPGTDVAELEERGLKIRHRYESIPSVAGTMPAGKASALAALEQVERIESDEGEMRAL
jgi:hypothetical protein